MTTDSVRRTARRQLALAALLAGAVVLAGAGATHAQQATPPSTHGPTVGGSAAVASVWDDETHLGGGIGLAAEVSTPLGPFVRVGVESGWLHHTRNAGYLAAKGDVLHVMGRADLMFLPRTWPARGFVGVGVGIARSTGTLSFQEVNARGAPVSTAQTPWTYTQPAWNIHLGARIAASPRLVLRPEVSTGIIGAPNTNGSLQLPLLRLQGGLAVEWALR